MQLIAGNSVIFGKASAKNTQPLVVLLGMGFNIDTIPIKMNAVIKQEAWLVPQGGQTVPPIFEDQPRTVSTSDPEKKAISQSN